ncbi:MAG TPA: ABC transporter permease [Candidatus Thermoplasmatota archaeon]|nr:ABC transporter permease [Candidatus Thermoplasmatota archaeon]
MALPWSEVADVSLLTLEVAAAAPVLGALVGVPVGAAIGTRGRGGRGLLRALVYALYGLPPVIAGLLGYLLLSRSGPLGGLGWLFTPQAIVLVEAMLAAPLVAGLTIAALAEVPPGVREAVRASGASPLLARWTLLKEARFGILAAVMVGFGRALAEVAGALMVGGNVPGETRTLGTAILQQVQQGDFGAALALGGVLLALALATVLALVRLQAAGRQEDG